MKYENASPQHETSRDYSADLLVIIDKPLTIETIDSYADDALDQLIDLVSRASIDYNYQPTQRFTTEKDTETAAFDYYGLDDIERLLDFVADKADELRDIDQLIDRSQTSDRVITPPGARTVNLGAGDSKLGTKATIPRLKTLLFVLSNQFEVDLQNPMQLSIKTGAMTSIMMRRKSYYVVKVPALNRTVLVCDEEGNATFVLDDTTLQKLGITPSDLQPLTKAELNDLIDEVTGLGRRLVFTKNFVPLLIAALSEPLASTNHLEPNESQTVTGKFLRPKRAKGNTSINRLATLWKVSHRAISTALNEVSSTLADLDNYSSTTGLSTDQQAIIHARLEAKGLFAPKAPADIASFAALAKLWGVDHETVVVAASEVSEVIGEIGDFRFGSTTTAPGFSTDQQAIIHARLEAKGLFAPKAPADIASFAALAKLWGVAHKSVVAAASEVSEVIGEIGDFRFDKKKAPGLSPDQLAIIYARLAAKGLFAEKAPDDYASFAGMARSWGVDYKSVVAATAEVGEAIGEVGKYRFNTRTAPGFSIDQQAIIYARLAAKAKQPRTIRGGS